jgi:hypothetical protein
MASDHTFDIVSEVDMQELSNALDQTRKEIIVRYDFKGVPVEIENKDEKDKKELVITTADDYKLKAVMDMLESKLLKRGLDLKILGTPKNEPASGGSVRSTIPLVAGVSQEKAKVINKLIRDSYPKVKTQIQGDTVRVTSTSIDDLQAVMALLKSSPSVDIPLQFENYR